MHADMWNLTVHRSEANSSSSKQNFTVLEELILRDNEFVTANVTAVNSVGESPPALMIIPVKGRGRCLYSPCSGTTFTSTRSHPST